MPALHDFAGLHITAQKQLDARLLALTVSTRALLGTPGNKAVNGPANVRILLPADYASHPHRRYPVLYLIHGTSGGAADWTTAEAPRRPPPAVS